MARSPAFENVVTRSRSDLVTALFSSLANPPTVSRNPYSRYWKIDSCPCMTCYHPKLARPYASSSERCRALLEGNSIFLCRTALTVDEALAVREMDSSERLCSVEMVTCRSRLCLPVPAQVSIVCFTCRILMDQARLQLGYILGALSWLQLKLCNRSESGD